MKPAVAFKSGTYACFCVHCDGGFSGAQDADECSHCVERIAAGKPTHSYPFNGYAPGHYLIVCRDCKEQIWNADKRAWRCEDCADKYQSVIDYTPSVIALCGPPGHGKSTLQRILETDWKVKPVDDGRAGRDIAKAHFGLTEEQVTTAAGKNSFVEVNGADIQVRDVLGRILNALEAQFGSDITAWLATRDLRAGGHYSFGSVRRQQAAYYKRLGGLVIEIVDPRKPSSAFEFDGYDRSFVDYTIVNDGTIEELRGKVAEVFAAWNEQRRAA